MTIFWDEVNQIFIPAEKRSTGTRELMTLCWTETDVDAQRVNFARGKTERGRSDLYRVLVSRSAFLFRDFRSRASLLYNRDFFAIRYFEIPK